MPVPPVTTPRSRFISQLATSWESTRSPSGLCSKIVLPSGPTIFWMKYGEWWMPPLATVDMTVAISTGVAMIVPSVNVSTGSRWMPGVDGRLGLIPILPAIETTLLMPTASSMRANAQLTESAVGAADRHHATLALGVGRSVRSP